MKRVFWQLPMIAIALWLIVVGVKDGLSDYYPDFVRVRAIAVVAWGLLIAVGVTTTWIRPGNAALRFLAAVVFVPITLILAGNIWSAMQFGWDIDADSVAISAAVLVAMGAAYACLAYSADRGEKWGEH